MPPRPLGLTKRFVLRLPPELYAALLRQSAEHGRSVNAEIVALLKQHVARRQRREREE